MSIHAPEEWIEKGQQIPVSDAVDMTALPIHYDHNEEGVKTRTVSINSIMPTRQNVNSTIVEHYIKRTRMTDQRRQMPFGIRFRGSNKVYLLDGNHRLIACRRKGRKRFRLRVVDYECTLQEALLYEFTLMEWIEIVKDEEWENECDHQSKPLSSSSSSWANLPLSRPPSQNCKPSPASAFYVTVSTSITTPQSNSAS